MKKNVPKEISNKSASYHYDIKSKFTAGMVLVGSEVKSIRTAQVSFNDSYCLMENPTEVVIKSLYIKEYKNAAYANHDPVRDRKLLLTKQELKKLSTRVKEKGFTIIPLRIFFNENHKVKIEIALATGKKTYDKRDSIKERDVKRNLARGED